LATDVAILGNFGLNNVFTFRDRRLRGWRLARGLLTFAAVCSVGAVGNIGVASFLFGPEQRAWWLAGLAGATMSLVWNYAASAVVTWRVAR
jgi:dolichol-phosphate mannosyltransferase